MIGNEPKQLTVSNRWIILCSLHAGINVFRNQNFQNATDRIVVLTKPTCRKIILKCDQSKSHIRSLDAELWMRWVYYYDY